MMNNTYSLVISQSERAWSFQWARTLIALERRLAQTDLVEYQRKYSINLATPASKDEREDAAAQFVPALMIIKRMSYTRAERRRLVLGYWQVSSLANTLDPRTSDNRLTNFRSHQKSIRSILANNRADREQRAQLDRERLARQTTSATLET